MASFSARGSLKSKLHFLAKMNFWKMLVPTFECVMWDRCFVWSLLSRADGLVLSWGLWGYERIFLKPVHCRDIGVAIVRCNVPDFGHQMNVIDFHMNNTSYHYLCKYERIIQKFLWEHWFFEVDIVRYSVPNYGHI